ncbi:hypothetical protein [Adlercreutzia sp. ZJ242]|uniref:hypothetical protein n=1 Tax=Adlercreutzia sp. ZJ242 TaxID=2709409 RepID=UPI0013EAC07A|nr:hypothetical protein [Adlercreutzia sp. ZJ242]
MLMMRKDVGDMPRTFLRKAVIALVLGIASLALGACASPSSQDSEEPFAPKASTLDSAGLYGPGETIEAGGIIAGGKDQPKGEEVSVGYPSIMRMTSPPEGVSVSDFKGGAFDESSSEAMEEQLGFAPGPEGSLPSGYSYVVVELAVSNTGSATVSYDVSQGRFIEVDEAGTVSNVGTNDPLWHDAWEGGNLKLYWIVDIEAGATIEIKLLYVLPDDAIDDERLAYLVDPGGANGEEGFVGLKAFDVAGQIRE